MPNFPPISLSARRFALAWRNVQHAASTDPDRPALCRTTLIERHSDGVLLVSTDGYLMLWAWAADDDCQQYAPGMDEAPQASVLVADPSGLPAALMKYLIKSTKDGQHIDRKSTIELSVGTFNDQPDQPTLGGDLERSGLILSAFNEKVVAPIVELDFPDWRRVARARPVKSAARVGLAGQYLAKLGAISTDDHGGVWCSFLGQKNGIGIEVPGDPGVSGRLMPLVDYRAPGSDEVDDAVARLHAMGATLTVDEETSPADDDPS